jgi:hypothetical protein
LTDVEKQGLDGGKFFEKVPTMRGFMRAREICRRSPGYERWETGGRRDKGSATTYTRAPFRLIGTILKQVKTKLRPAGKTQRSV